MTQKWIKATWKLPLMVNLLSKGVMPSLPYSELNEAINYLPEKLQFIYKSKKSFENSWSLQPLKNSEEQVLENRWIESAP